MFAFVRRKSEIFVTIEVLDVDEYPLELAEIPSLKVPENTPVDTLVYTAWVCILCVF